MLVASFGVCVVLHDVFTKFHSVIVGMTAAIGVCKSLRSFRFVLEHHVMKTGGRSNTAKGTRLDSK